jgi:hypothetical protein
VKLPVVVVETAEGRTVVMGTGKGEVKGVWVRG